MAAPEEYGGLGLGVFDTALVSEEIAKVCYPTAMAVLGEVGVQTRILTHYAPEGFAGGYCRGWFRAMRFWRSA
jgi:alkylation response protein AidB-like acyl-CoA dehydrogenase